MKYLCQLIIGLTLVGPCLAKPFALIRSEIKGEQKSDGTVTDEIYYTEKDALVLVISETRSIEENKVIKIEEGYYCQDELVFRSIWLPQKSEKGTLNSIFSSSEKIKSLLIHTQDSENDAFLDEVIVFSRDFDAVSFRRNENGEMMPVSPLITTDDGEVYFQEKGDEPVGAGQPM